MSNNRFNIELVNRCSWKDAELKQKYHLVHNQRGMYFCNCQWNLKFWLNKADSNFFRKRFNRKGVWKKHNKYRGMYARRTK